MVSSTEIFSETLTYPGLERMLHNVLSPAIAVDISQISYRPGYLPNPDNDRLLLSQIVTINNQPLIADSVEIWIKEGLQLVTFPIDSAYSLRLVFPAWYQEIAVTVSTIDGLALAPGSGSVTSQAGLNAAIAQFNAALALKSAAVDVAAALATKADVSSLADFISTSELIQALTLKADVNHDHDDLYYPKAETYNRDEVNAAIAGISVSSDTPTLGKIHQRDSTWQLVWGAGSIQQGYMWNSAKNGDAATGTIRLGSIKLASTLHLFVAGGGGSNGTQKIINLRRVSDNEIMIATNLATLLGINTDVMRSASINTATAAGENVYIECVDNDASGGWGWIGLGLDIFIE